MNDSTDTTIRPFTLDIPQADLDDLRDRLDRARWPDELPGDVDDGIKQSYVRSLYDYWRTYVRLAGDRGADQRPSAVHDRDRRPERPLPPRPLPRAERAAADRDPRLAGLDPRVLRHHRPAHRPRAHGGDPADAFDLVIPSMPGYGFSGPTRERGWNNYPDRGGLGGAHAPPRLRALRRRGQRRRLDDLAGGRPARSRPRRRRPRHPALLVPVGRPVRVRGHDRGGDDRAGDAPVVLREQDVVQQGLLRAAADAWLRASPTRRWGCSPGTPSCSARTSTRTSSCRTSCCTG